MYFYNFNPGFGLFLVILKINEIGNEKYVMLRCFINFKKHCYIFFIVQNLLFYYFIR